ncbi:hypothetical protein IGW_05335 [Bacillus cereus ISP3191]|nr:hypothetical protein IGW_05335 [Bacillus cereus ISP3191]MDR4319755.1 hypothetical protein [Bacillus paranthracis]
MFFGSESIGENILGIVLIVLLIGCVVILFTTSNSLASGIFTKRKLVLLIGYDALILIVLGVLSMLVAMILITAIAWTSSKIGLDLLIIFIKMNMSMNMIFFSFIIQLFLYIKLNDWFKKKVFKKYFNHEQNEAFDYLKIYQSSEISKVYSIANIIITVVLLGSSRDYGSVAANIKLPFFDGPLFLFTLAMSIYVMNAYLFWISPTNNSIFNLKESSKPEK